jgi:hypothetical protein
MTDKNDAPTKKIPMAAELIIPVGGTVFAIYYLYTIWSLPWQATTAGFGIISGMAIVMTFLIIRYVRLHSAGALEFSFGELLHPVGMLGKRLAVLVAGLGFIFIMPYLGFTLSVFVFVVIAVLILAGSKYFLTALMLGAGMSLGGYLLFIVFIRARFPHGAFENLAGSLF